jgi:hypothetical protein
VSKSTTETVLRSPIPAAHPSSHHWVSLRDWADTEEAEVWAWDRFGPSLAAFSITVNGGIGPIKGKWTRAGHNFYFTSLRSAFEFKMRWG